MTPENILKHYWGHSNFRKGQSEIIDAVINGRDTLALLPTGGGKSVCYQVPGLYLDGLTIVISPLIALMKDQVEQLNHRNISAVALYSGLQKREIDIVLDNCIYGDIKFLYVSPERLKTDLFRERFKKMKVSLIAVDEAHCISLWGHDFRPPYREIHEIREIHPEVPLIALTATATEEVTADILDQLELKDPFVFKKSFARINISYAVRESLDKANDAYQIIEKVPGTAIIYASTRKETKDISQFLKNKGLSADFYHAGLSADQRSAKQDAWIKNKIRVIVATNAFGMGIDKPDVRMVIHTHLPPSPEAYYQEAGRAGRDGQRSYSVILHSAHDKKRRLEDFEIQNPELSFIKRVYQALANYLSVAVGSGEGSSHDFNITQFCDNFNFDPRAVFHVLQKLEHEGLIMLNEPFRHPSRLWVLSKRNDLYKFQIENVSYDPLIQNILRFYGGEIFTQFITIDEFKLAQAMKTDKETVVKMLKMLHQVGIMDYDPQNNIPQISFPTERYDSDYLPIDAKLLRKRRESEREKTDEIIQYIENTKRCRNQILLDYFGELSTEECGHCDNCIAKKQRRKGFDHESYRVQILNLLSDGPADIDLLEKEINPTDKEHIEVVIRELIDEELIRYNEVWQLELTEPENSN